ncbi:sulfate/molybdate ABC transporter ATP-binding protein [Brevibacillus daliensis]|uniref:sulfate/molybdate ABC transporter ATP-binding protein n=1 Tax=Brevibacillus daliensis TaxID=2892995 RepID=UPI001E4DDD86|nr:sulfate ABC transporter ATP-binding protein [Brevibacillus daliensis]
MGISIHNVSKTFGNFNALQDVSLTIPSGKLVALLGPSGSGKTTLLRLIAGLEQMEQGQILFDGEDTTTKSIQERQVGFVFQHYALFRHMSVFDNVAFGLQVRSRTERPAKTEIRAKVRELLRLVQLDGLESRFPAQLSGGQRQRVALARALAIEPKVLLLDEPFGALDAKVRQELRKWLKQLHHALQITTVFVTHDQEEALEMADEVVIVNKGGIEQVGSPVEVYQRPANPFVYSFLGRVNTFTGKVVAGEFQLGALRYQTEDTRRWNNSHVVGYIRPHELEVAPVSGGEGWAAAELTHISMIGPLVRLECKLIESGIPFEIEVSGEQYLEITKQVKGNLYVNVKQMRLFATKESPIQLEEKNHIQSVSLAVSELKA